MLIRKFKVNDAKQVANLIIKTFCEQITSAKNVQKFFAKHNTPVRILELSKRADILVAELNNKIVGIIAGTIDSRTRVIRLFVDLRVQRQGIASKIMCRLESLYKKRGIKTIHFRSSLYAMPFYKTLGYKKVTRLIRDKNGIVYWPMIKNIIC